MQYVKILLFKFNDNYCREKNILQLLRFSRYKNEQKEAIF